MMLLRRHLLTATAFLACSTAAFAQWHGSRAAIDDWTQDVIDAGLRGEALDGLMFEWPDYLDEPLPGDVTFRAGLVKPKWGWDGDVGYAPAPRDWCGTVPGKHPRVRELIKRKVRNRVLNPPVRTVCPPVRNDCPPVRSKCDHILVEFPEPATNLVGEPHQFVTCVKSKYGKRSGDGFVVTYTLLGGPGAVFEESGDTIASVRTDRAGRAAVTLLQTDPVEGKNVVQIDVIKPGDMRCCGGGHVATGCATKEWIIPRVPELEFEIACMPEASICDPVEYEVMIRNVGNGVARSVSVRSGEGFDDQVGADHRGVELKHLGSIAPGQTRTARFLVDPGHPGQLDYRARVLMDGEVIGEATCSTLIREPVLDVQLSAPQQRYIGRDAVIEATVANLGDAPAERVMLQADLPKWARPAVNDDARVGNGSVRWMLDSIAPGESVTRSFAVRSPRPGAIETAVRATSDCGEAFAQIETDIVGIAALLLEVVDTDDPIEVGATETYVIKITNQGSADDTGIQVVCDIPDAFEIVRPDGPTSAVVDGRAIVFDPLARLAPRQTVTYRLTLRGIAPADARFGVSVTSDQTVEPILETESTHIYE